MADDLLDKIPAWLKSLWQMETELRNSARSGLILRKDDALKHLTEARRHLEEAMKPGRSGDVPANEPTAPSQIVRPDATTSNNEPKT